MNIVRVEAIPVAVPLKRSHHMASGEISRVEYVIVRVVTDQGLIGFGEAPLEQGPIFSEETIGSVCDVILRFIGPQLVGKNPALFRSHSETWKRSIKRNFFAKAAVEMALLDVTGQATGWPVYRLLGGACRETLPVSYSLGTGDPDKEIEEINTVLPSGVSLFKIKVGFRDLWQDLRRIRKIVEHFSGKARFRVDANEGWTYPEARRAIAVLSDLPIDFVEQPISRHNISLISELVKHSPIPIAADESVFGPEEALVVCGSRAADIVSIKIQKAGGLLASQEIAAICRAAGVGGYLGGMFETGIGTAAALHFGATAPGLTFGCELIGPLMLAHSLVTQKLPLANGQLHVPQSPGLGISVDEEAIRGYALSKACAA